MPEPVVALVVAAGSGVRLGTSDAGGTGPKALRLLAGVPLVRWSVDAMLAAGAEQVVVVVTPGHEAAFSAATRGLEGQVTLTPGGARRQDSVAAGLAALGDVREAVVLVQDAARPLVPVQVVRDVVAAVRGGAAAVIPVVAVTDSIRRVRGSDSDVVDRSDLRAVQTPQGFLLTVLRDAHAAAARAEVEYTDDAAVCEAVGHTVTLVPGSRRSLKITEPVDFALAEALLEDPS